MLHSSGLTGTMIGFPTTILLGGLAWKVSWTSLSLLKNWSSGIETADQ